MYVKHLHYAAFQNVATYNDYMEKSSGVSASNNIGLNSGLTLYQGGRPRPERHLCGSARDAAFHEERRTQCGRFGNGR